MLRFKSLRETARRGQGALLGGLSLAVLLLAACMPMLGPEKEGVGVAATATPTPEAVTPEAEIDLREQLAAPLPEKATRPAPPLPAARRVTATVTSTVTGTANGGLAGLLPTVTPTGGPTGTGSTLADLLPTPTPRITATTEVTATKIAATAAGDAPTGRVNAAVVNLRGGPGTHYLVVGQTRQGDALAIAGRTETGDWLKVCCPIGEEAESWISAAFVEADLADGQTLATVPVAAIPPTPAAPPPAARGAGNTSAAALAAAPAPDIPGPGNFGAPGGTNPLTGQGLPGGRAGQRPVIVCINNDYAARPQFGTSQADVMYEYLMEGYGITRFSAIYYGSDAAQIGPVRSARLINYYMGALYNAGLVCSGASDPVRYSLKHEAPFPYMDIDLDDPNNSRYSVSVGSDYRTRLRTATDKLHRWLGDWGVEQPASIRGFTFGGAPGGGAPATSISIPYPRGTGSQVAYRYDAGSGRYLRSLGGGPHVDGNTGAQLGLENVIVQYVPHQATNIVEDSLGSTSIRLNLFGSGQAIVFRDGQAYAGTWRSESRGDMPRFFAADGSEISLKPGRTWISVVPLDYSIGYQ